MTDLLPISQLADQIDADSWTPLNLNTLPDKPPIRPDLAHTGLVYPGKRHVFSGPPESAKTLAAYTILIQTARTGQTGILIDFEMGPYDARQRLHELGATIDELDRILYLEPDQPATDQRVAALIAQQPALVVVDAAAGAYQLEGLDDNKRGDVEKISRLYVTAFWRHGIATILIDHVVKNSDDRGRFVIGSERKLGGADVHLGFDTITPVSRGTNGRYKITTHKDRGGYLKRGHLADLRLESDPDTNEITWTFTSPEQTTDGDGYFRPTNLMEKASIYLELASEPATRNQVYNDALNGKGKGRTAAIDALVREGFVTETAGPNRSKLLTSVRSYRENDPTCNPENTHGGAVVQEWFSSGASTTHGSGGAVVRVPYGTATPEPPTDQPPTPPSGANPEPLGWFDNNGHLTDTDLEWLDHIAPDPPADTDTDWTHP